MTQEFKKIKSKMQTRYVLETASAGATSAGSVATAPSAMPKLIKRKMENFDHPDHEVDMAKSDLHSLAKQSIELYKILQNISEEQGLEGWQQAKITKAADYINSVLKSLSHDTIEKEGFLGGVAGGIAGAALTKSASGASAGYSMGSSIQDALSGAEDSQTEGLRDPEDNPCWKGYKPVGTKNKNGKTVPNCVPTNESEYEKHLYARLESLIAEKAPPGDKYERMVKHIKKGYAKDGKLSKKEKSIAYATAWKEKNKAKK